MGRAGLLLSLVAAGVATPALAADLTPTPAIEGEPYTQGPWIVGHLDFGLGARFPESNFSNPDEFGIFNIFGRANLALFGGTLNVEADVGGWGFFDDGDSDSTLGGIGHVWLRLPGAAVGAFGGVTDYFGTDIPTAGLEGEAYFGNVTLGAQGSYNWDDGGDVWSIGGSADIYFNPDLRLGGEVAYWNIGGADIWQADIDIEKRFTGTPISAGASLSYFEGEDFNALTGMFHVRLFMDPAGSTLQWHDREVPFEFSLPLFGG